MSEKVPVTALIRHELRQLLRDGRFRWMGVIVAALLITSGFFAFSHADAMRAEREEAQQTAARQWTEQGEKNPHAAAHYGTYVFKPAGALSFLDPGVEASLGVTVKLQAHARSSLEGAAAQDSTAIKHFGGLSPAAILQLILPLLIIGLAFNAWSAERERGTLRQVMSYGVPPRRLLWGKLVGLGAALALLMLPAVALGALGLALLPAPSGLPLGRALTLGGVYAVYAAIFLLAALWVSAQARSSRGALVVLLGLWGITSLILPRLAGDLVDAALPLPDAATFAAELERSMEEGLPGGPDREARVEALLTEILEREGFEGGLMMMQGSLLQGLELEAEAAFEREVIDHHFGALVERSREQEAALQGLSWLSPFIAVRTLSMSLAGTDLAHHQHFSEAAEAYRRALVDQLNQEFSARGGDDGWAYQANRALWESAPDFVYASPELGWALQRQQLCALALLFWLAIMASGAVIAARRIKVVG